MGFFPVKKISRSTVKHGWNHRSISSGMTRFYDERWTHSQYDTNWIPFAESIHACAWFTFRETLSRCIYWVFSWLFDMLTWECSVAPGHGLCEVRKHRWYPNITHEALKSHLGWREGKGKTKGSAMRWIFCTLFGLGLMDWAAVNDWKCRCAQSSSGFFF